MTACTGCPPRHPTTATTQPPIRARCGDHHRYHAGCRPCQNASAARQRARTRAKAYGHQYPGEVDAAPARQHITHLRDTHGMTLRHIAEIAGVAHASVARVAAGGQYVMDATAARICAVRPAPPKPGHPVSAVGAARMLQALAAIGYGPAELAPLLDESPAEVRRLRRRYRPHVSAQRAATVAAVYRHLQGTPGPSDRARAESRLRNWAPPLAWDDVDHIADPDREPAYDAAGLSARMVERACGGEVPASALNEAERKAAVSRLLGAGLTARQIGDRLSWSGGGRAGRVAVATYLERVRPTPLRTLPRRPSDDGWFDAVKVERALRGERVRLTVLERQHAVQAGVPRLGLHGVATALRVSYSTARDLYRRPLPDAEAATA